MRAMKQIVVFIALIAVMFSSFTFVFAENDKLMEIHEQLTSKTINNYHTIIAPLQGDPENFNIRPSDDLNTIRFGDGYIGYDFDYNLLEKNYKKGKQKLEDVLVETPRYYFPIIVSDRPVALATINETTDGYKVISVSAGSVSDNFFDVVNNKSGEGVKYIYAPSIATGFLITDHGAEQFVDLDTVDESTPNTRSTEDNLVKVMYERYQIAKSSSGLTGSAGIDTTVPNAPNQSYIMLVPVAVLVVAGASYLYIRRKKAQ